MDLYKGADETILATITSPSGAALDISTVIDIVAILYYKQTGVVLSKYRKITTAGYEPLTVVSGPAGSVKILLNRVVTVNAPVGLVVMDVKLQFTDTAFQSGVFTTVKKGVTIGMMQDTATKGELLSTTVNVWDNTLIWNNSSIWMNGATPSVTRVWDNTLIWNNTLIWID